MSVKLNSRMEISQTIVKNCNQINQFSVDVMVDTSDIKDCIFDNGEIDAHKEKVEVTSTSNCQDSNTLDLEISRPRGCDRVTASEGSDEDEEVNVVEDFDCIDRDLQDATESESESESESSCSSSFGCTDSETENPATGGDEEVESLIREDNASLGFDVFNGLFRTRKKKVSDHWRDFVRPLMWRCRWVELCVRELNSKAFKYEKELAENYKRKQNEREKKATEDLCMRSIPYVCENGQQVMRRRKRKKVEDTDNLGSYTSCHNLFSYYANRKPIAGSSYTVYDRLKADPAETDTLDDAPIANDEFPAFDFNENDAFEIILRKIEEAQSQVRQLSFRIDKVVTENAEKFTSENASASPEVKATPLPVMTESIGNPIKCENMENDGFLLLSHNEAVKQEVNAEVKVEAGNSLVESRGKAIQQHPNSPNNTHISIFKATTTPRKRKRGRRKPRIGKWTRRSSASASASG